MKSPFRLPSFHLPAAVIRPRAVLLAACLLAVGLALHAAPAAAVDHNLEIDGTSTGPGTCSITIESFGFDPENAAGASAALTQYLVNVSIPAGSTPDNSAHLIRDAADNELPPDFVITIHPVLRNIVVFSRTPGTFTMSISENVPGQSYREVAEVYVPALNGTGMLVMGGLLAIGAVWFLGRRRRSGVAPA